MFLKLHNAFSGREVVVNSLHISCIEHSAEIYAGDACITLVSGVEIQIKEKYIDLIAMLEQVPENFAPQTDCPWR